MDGGPALRIHDKGISTEAGVQETTAYFYPHAGLITHPFPGPGPAEAPEKHRQFVFFLFFFFPVMWRFPG